MHQYADDEVNDDWDDDFVFEDKAPVENKPQSQKLSGTSGRSVDIQFETDEPELPWDGDVGCLPEDLLVDGEDDIPEGVIGFDHMSEDEELDNDEPLALDLFAPPTRPLNEALHLSMSSKTSTDRSSGNFPQLGLPNSGSQFVANGSNGERRSFSSVDIAKVPWQQQQQQQQQQQRTGADATVQSISSGTKSMPYDKLSSSESESAGRDAKSTVDYGRGQVDHDDDDDENNWDDMLDVGAPSVEDPRSIRQSHPFSIDAEPVVAVPEKESLLDFLDSNVKTQVLEHGKINRAGFVSPSLGTLAQELEEGAELANHHLRGVFGWASTVSDSLDNLASEVLGSRTLNDAVWEETLLLSATEEFVHQTLDHCLQFPYRESNLYSLELVARWLSGYCVTNEFLTQSNHIIAERISVACLQALSALEVLRTVVNNRMVELILVLKEEQSALFQRFSPRPEMHPFPGQNLHRGVMERVFDCFGLLLTVFRLQCRFTDVQLHLAFIDDHNNVLERIEAALDFLDVMLSYVEVVRLCVPLASGDDLKTAQDYLRIGVKQEELIFRTKVTTMVKSALASKMQQSVFHHRFEEKHVQFVREAITDFGGLLLSSKLLFMAHISPITFQPVVLCLLQQSSRMQSLPYNVAYDLPVGAQSQDLMQRLESPSIVRAKLAFSLSLYVECLLRRGLWWQGERSRGVFYRKRTKGFLRRNESDLAFGIDAADAAFVNEDMSVAYVEEEVTRSLLDSFGSSNDLSNQQLFLLLEVAVDLFPKASALGSGPLNPPKSQLPFAHSTSALNFSANIVDNLKDADKLFLIAQRDPRLPLASAYYAHALYFSHAFISAFARIVHDPVPALTLELVRLEFLVYRRISGGDEPEFALLQRAFFTALRLHRAPVAIVYGEALWASLSTQSADLDTVVLVGKLLAEQYEEEAQYELSIRVLVSVMERIQCEQQERLGPRYRQFVRSQQLDDLSKRLASCFIQLGDHEHAAKVLLAHLVELSQRRPSLHTDEQRVCVLSLLLKTYGEFGDADTCSRLIRAIKKVRQSRLDQLYEELGQQQTQEKSGKTRSNASGTNFSEHASFSAGSSSSMNSMSGFLFYGSTSMLLSKDGGSGQGNANGPTTGNNNANNNSSGYSFVGRGSPAVPAGPQMLSSGSAANSTNNLRISPAVEAPAVTINAKAARFQWNDGSSYLPQFCLSSHGLDLGLPLAQVYYRSGLFVSALNALTPTIIGVENAVRGKLGSRSSVLELAELYYLRGKIQLEASRTTRAVRFPFEVGSPEVCVAVQTLSAALPPAVQRGRSFFLFHAHRQLDLRKRRSPPVMHALASSSAPSRLQSSTWKDSLRAASDFNFTCKRMLSFYEPADLLWDAMKWFRKAWDLFHTAGDEIRAARAANRIAKCHLLPCFVPYALMGTPLREALDLSCYQRAAGSAAFAATPPPVDDRGAKDKDGAKPQAFAFGQTRGKAALPPQGMLPSIPPMLKPGAGGKGPPLHPVSSSLGAGSGTPTPSVVSPNPALNRFASLEEVEKVSNFALDVHIESSLPLGLMDSYLNLAELFVLRGMKKDALLYWWEAKDLFLTLFADGCLLPLMRRSSAGFSHKLRTFLDRLVRFLWIADYRKARDEHVFLLEILQLCRLEENRVGKHRSALSRVMAADVNKVLARHVFRGAPLATSSSAARPSEVMSESARLTLQASTRFGATADASEKIASHSIDAEGLQPDVLVVQPAPIAAPRRAPKKRGVLSRMMSLFSCSNARAVETRPQAAPGSLLRRLTRGPSMQMAEEALAVDTALSASGPLPIPANHPWAHGVADAVLQHNLGRLLGLSVAESLSLLLYGRTLPKLFSYSWAQLTFDRVYTNRGGKGALCGAFSSAMKAHVLTWVDLLGEDGLAQQQTNKMLPDNTWRKMQQRAPLHAVEDFAWLDSEFWLGHSAQSKQHRHACGSASARVAHYDFNVLWDVLCKYRQGSADAERELVAEDLVLEKLWRLLLRLRNLCNNYADKFSSTKSFSRSVRATLLQFSGNMMRLRCFSRQFKADIVNPSVQQSLLRKIQVQQHHTPRSPSMSGRTVHSGIAAETSPHMSSSPHSSASHLSSVSAEEAANLSMQLLLQRFSRVVYVLQIRELLLLFHPHTGRDQRIVLGGPSARTAQSVSQSADEEHRRGGIAASHQSAQDPSATSREAKLSVRETQMLCDLCTVDEDAECGNGVAKRTETLQQLCQGALYAPLVFLVGCYHHFSALPTLSTTTETGSLHSESTFDLQRIAPGPRSPLPPGVQAQSSQSLLAQLVPAHNVPLLLVCGLQTQLLPWEALLRSADVPVTRGMGVLDLFQQLVSLLHRDEGPWNSGPRPLASALSLRPGGFSKVVKPAFCVVSAQSAQVVMPSAEHFADLASRLESRRQRAVVHGLTALHQNCEHLSLHRGSEQNSPGTPIATTEKRSAAVPMGRSPSSRPRASPSKPWGLGSSAAQAAPPSPTSAALSPLPASTSLPPGAQRVKWDKLLLQRLRLGTLPLPALLPARSHISSLFGRGDLLSLPLNFRTSSYTAQRAAEVDVTEPTLDAFTQASVPVVLAPAVTPSVDAEARVLHVEVALFCKHLDQAAANYVSVTAQQLTSGDGGSQWASQAEAGAAEPLLPAHQLLSVLLLSYSDLAEFNPATMALLGRHCGDSTAVRPVVLFAPSFVQERLLVELKLALDRWQKGDLQLAHALGPTRPPTLYLGQPSLDLSMGSFFSSAHSSVNAGHASARWLKSRSESLDRLSTVSRQDNALSRSPSQLDSVANLSSTSLLDVLSGSTPASPQTQNPDSPAVAALTAHLSTSSAVSTGSFGAQSLSRRGSDPDPFSHLDRVESGGQQHFANFFFAQRPPSAPSSLYGSLVDFPHAPVSGLSAIPLPAPLAPGSRLTRPSSATSAVGRGGGGGSFSLPPPPPPLSTQTSLQSQLPHQLDLDDPMEAVDTSRMLGSNADQQRAKDDRSDSSHRHSPMPVEQRVVLADPCWVVLQVVHRMELDQATSIVVYI